MIHHETHVERVPLVKHQEPLVKHDETFKTLWNIMKHSNTRQSMRWYRRSLWRYRHGVSSDIGVGITPHMCNRVTNHGDMGISSRPVPSLSYRASSLPHSEIRKQQSSTVQNKCGVLTFDNPPVPDIKKYSLLKDKYFLRRQQNSLFLFKIFEYAQWMKKY